MYAVTLQGHVQLVSRFTQHFVAAGRNTNDLAAIPANFALIFKIRTPMIG